MRSTAETYLYFQELKKTGIVSEAGSIRSMPCEACEEEGEIRNRKIDGFFALSLARVVVEKEAALLQAELELAKAKEAFEELFKDEGTPCPACDGYGSIKDPRYAR